MTEYELTPEETVLVNATYEIAKDNFSNVCAPGMILGYFLGKRGVELPKLDRVAIYCKFEGGKAKIVIQEHPLSPST